jgi:hypothetical protein
LALSDIRSASRLDKRQRKVKSARQHLQPKDTFMNTLARLMIASALVFSFAASGYAQMQAAPPATMAAPVAPAGPAMPKKPKGPMSAKAKECSAKADAQGLHGKARQEFREKCKKGEM